MGHWLDMLWVLFVLALAAWLAAVVCVSLVAPAALNEQLGFRARARRVVMMAGLPWIVPLTVVIAVSGLALAKQQGWVADHCLHHPGVNHPHLCFEHLPAIGLNMLHGAASAIPLLAVGIAAWRWRSGESQLLRRLRLLSGLASRRGRLAVVPQRRPFAWAADRRDPVIIVSRGLLDSLHRRERRIVVAHEAAHLRHADPVRSTWFGILLLLHPPGLTARLRRQWHKALEERADARVAQRFTPEAVAMTVLKVARLIGRDSRSPGLSIAGAGPQERVERLLAGSARSSVVFDCVYWTALVIIAVAAFTAHHRIESLLTLIPGI